jgi:catechol 2,3-dioxygenase-like lactoylglutathione lyase family enzyme
MDTKLEVVVLPVTDVDRAADFYTALGWRVDADLQFDERTRVVQLTPPGSSASVHVGTNLTDAAPGSSKAYLVVSDIEAARDELISRGADVSEVFHRDGSVADASGPDPERGTYRSYASFSDPDGNVWLMQEITTRLPGRIDTDATTYASVKDLAASMRRAEAAHGKYEAELGHRDEDWPTWYATYMAHEQAGTELPS